jgi:hypothetical protein
MTSDESRRFMENRGAKKTGTAYEVRIERDLFAPAELPWERAVQRGNRDLLDFTGCLPMGWLIGAKALRRKSGETPADKLNDAMLQCRRAVDNLEARGMPAEDVVPVQIIQRPGYETAQHYVVMEARDFLKLVAERRELEHWRAGAGEGL